MIAQCVLSVWKIISKNYLCGRIDDRIDNDIKPKIKTDGGQENDQEKKLCHFHALEKIQIFMTLWKQK